MRVVEKDVRDGRHAQRRRFPMQERSAAHVRDRIRPRPCRPSDAANDGEGGEARPKFNKPAAMCYWPVILLSRQTRISCQNAIGMSRRRCWRLAWSLACHTPRTSFVSTCCQGAKLGLSMSGPLRRRRQSIAAAGISPLVAALARNILHARCGNPARYGWRVALSRASASRQDGGWGTPGEAGWLCAAT